MTIRQILKAVVIFTASALSAPAIAADVRIIVDRMEDSVEIFLSLPAPLVPTALSGSTDGLSNGDGTFDLGVFRATGTAIEGDDVISGSRLIAGGERATVEAMSVMLHPGDLPLPFETPIDGVAAMSICTVPPTESLPSLESLQLYGGFIAYPAAGIEALNLFLGNEEPIEVVLAEFVEGRPSATRSMTLAPDMPISFAQADILPDRSVWIVPGLLALSGTFAVIGGVAWARARRQRTLAT